MSSGIPSPVATREADLAIQGMTCGACVARVETALNTVDGVTATGNLATERIHVVAPARIDDQVLIEIVRQAGYEARSAAGTVVDNDDSTSMAAAIRVRLIWAIALTIPVVILAMIPPAQFPGWQWASGALATPVVWWAGGTFHRGAWRALRHRGFSMDSLVSLGSVVAWTWSVVALVALGAGEIGMTMDMSLLPPHDSGAAVYFEVAAGIVALVLLGRFLEARARHSAGQAIRNLLTLSPTTAVVLRGTSEVSVRTDDVVVGDHVVVRPGGSIPVDGEVESGESTVNRALLTGESMPVEVGPGDLVDGGALNTGGRLVVRATRVGADTAVRRVAALVEAAQADTAPVQRLADRVSGVFVPVVILLALATLVGWIAAGYPAGEAMTAAVAVLVISCPCALGLATPVALMVGTGRGADLGILIRGPGVLESTRRVTVAVLDKTGTLTEGVMRVADVMPAPGQTAAEVLALAGAAEAGSEHPIGRAIAEAAAAAGPLAAVIEFRSRAGIGVTAQVGSRSVVVGRSDGATDALARIRDDERREGRTVVGVVIDGAYAGAIAVSDIVRPHSADAVAMLRELGIRPIMVTGDAAAPARAVADAVGIGEGDERRPARGQGAHRA